MDRTSEIKRMFAAPKYHPVTCANPGVWKIHDVMLRPSFSNGIEVSIRGENSMWFNANDCWVNEDQDELEDMVRIRDEQKLIASLYFVYET